MSTVGPFAVVPADLLGARVAKSRGTHVFAVTAVTAAIDVVATGIDLFLNS